MNDFTQAQILLMAIAFRLPQLHQDRLLQIALDSYYTDYFSASAALNDLIERRLLSSAAARDEEQRDAHGQPIQRLCLSPEGQHVYLTLKDRLKPSIHRYLDQLKPEIQQEEAVLCQIQAEEDGTYSLHYQLNERHRQLIDLRYRLPHEQAARRAKAHLLKHQEKLYSFLQNFLLMEPELSKKEMEPLMNNTKATDLE